MTLEVSNPHLTSYPPPSLCSLFFSLKYRPSLRPSLHGPLSRATIVASLHDQVVVAEDHRRIGQQ